MPNSHVVDPVILKKLLRYDPESGELFWLERGPEFISGHNNRKRWNNTFAGKKALACVGSEPYKIGTIFGRLYLAHRVIFAMHYGHWPKNMIDHINGNPFDNRIENLRDVTNLENQKNAFISVTNTSGYTGVSWNSKAKKWQVSIRVDGQSKYLGTYSDKEDAARARKNADKIYGYSERHGSPKTLSMEEPHD